MKCFKAVFISGFLAMACCLLGAEGFAAPSAFASPSAHDDHSISLEIENPWARETTPSAKNGAAYMTLKYTGDDVAYLTGASTDKARMVMLHTTQEIDGVATMRDAGEIRLDPGAEIRFEPGAMHFMLMGLKSRLKKGQIFRLTLHFKDHDDLVIPVDVTSVMGPKGTSMQKGDHKSDHKSGHKGH